MTQLNSYDTSPTAATSIKSVIESKVAVSEVMKKKRVLSSVKDIKRAQMYGVLGIDSIED